MLEEEKGSATEREKEKERNKRRKGDEMIDGERTK